MSHGRRPFECYEWTEEEQDALVQWAALRAEGELSTGPLGMTDVARALGAVTGKRSAEPAKPEPVPPRAAEAIESRREMERLLSALEG